MKLMRYGPKGREQPGLIDAQGRVRALSGVVPDIGVAELSATGLAKLRGVDPTTLPLSPPPVRARWLAPLAYRVLGFGVTDEVVASRSGLLTREMVAVPLARIQSVRVVQGPVAALLGLADVHVDTAGSLHVVGRHRDVREAYPLAADLAARSRRARARAALRAGH